MATKEYPLGLYLVHSISSVRPEFTEEDAASGTTDWPYPERVYLVIAESAEKAADSVAFQPNKPYERVPEDGVGRLGDYEPGIGGHMMAVQMAASHHNGAIVLIEEKE